MSDPRDVPDFPSDFPSDFGPFPKSGVTTARAILQDALERLGKYAAGEVITVADANRGIELLNDMMDSWSNEALTTFAQLEQSVQLKAGKTQYTIGWGGDIHGPRPLRVLTGPGAAYVVDSNNNRSSVDVYSQSSWNQIWNLESSNSNLPSVMFYNPQLPQKPSEHLGIINVWPKFNGSSPATLYFNSYTQLLGFEDLDIEIAFPVGYTKAIKDNLAIEIFPYFKSDGETIDPVLVEAARKSKSNIKRTNIRAMKAELDAGIPGGGGGRYNIYSDTSR